MLPREPLLVIEERNVFFLQVINLGVLVMNLTTQILEDVLLV